MIDRIDKIKDFGLFEDFEWSSDIPDFRQYNLIYGWNYSGKTMFSRIFRCIELKELHLDFPEAEFELTDDKNNKVRYDRLDNSPYQFRVFNTDFVKDNLQWDKQEAAPLFILGKEDIKLQNRIELLKGEIDTLHNEKNENENKKSNIKSDLENKLTNKARELDRIKPPYDKRKLRASLEKIKSDPGEHCLNDTQIQELLGTLKAVPKDKLPEVSLEILGQDELKEIEEALDKTVVSQTIERLKNDTELNNWVRTGLDLHRGKNKCEFCGGPLSENLLGTYEKHFSEEYKNLLDELNGIIQDLGKHKTSISLPDEKRFYPRLEEKYKNAKSEFENYIKGYNKNIETLIDLLKGKINNPFRKPSETVVLFDTNRVSESFNKLNGFFSMHNDICDNFKNEQKKAFEKLVLHYACEFNKENKYFDHLQKIQNLETKTKGINRNIEEKKAEITGIEPQLSDIARAADKINQYLRSIFGKEHLKIESTNENKLKVLRDGTSATNLSEGEKTAVAFSYFLTRLKDKETDISNAIVFIDDPVSSLDSNHLYNTFAVIQSKLENCKQLFISTHNFDFFNLLKEWLKGIKGNKDKCRYYLIERIVRKGSEISDISKLPSLLLDFKSEYHFLFYKIKSFANNPTTDFASLYQLPNIIRRFLEAFIGFKYAKGLKKGLGLLISDDSERIKVDKFINNLSHQTGLSRSLFFADSNECKGIVDIVLKAVEDSDRVHYGVLEDVYNNASS